MGATLEFLLFSFTCFSALRDRFSQGFFSWFVFWVPKTLAQQQSGRADVLTDIGVYCVSRAAVSMVQLPPCPPAPSVLLHCGPFSLPLSGAPVPSSRALQLSIVLVFGVLCWKAFSPYLDTWAATFLFTHNHNHTRTHAHALRRHKQQNYCLRPSHVAALIFTPRTIPTPPASGCVYWPF